MILLLCLGVLFGLLFGVGLFLMVKRPQKPMGRILFSAALVILIGFVGLVLLVLAAFSGLASKFYMPLTIIALLYLMLLVILAGAKKLWGKRLLITILLGALAVGIAVGVYKTVVYIDESVLTIGESDLLYEYVPFREGNKLATLDEPASFSIMEDLPVLDGATALYPVYSAFAQAIFPEGAYEMTESAVRCSTTGEAYEALINGEVDMIFAAAPSKEQEEAAIAAGKPLKLTPIGREAFVFYVHQKNPVNTLTVQQIQGIYSGEITNWSLLGGKRSDIRAFQRNEGSGSQTALQKLMADIPIMPPRMEDRYDAMMGIVKATADYKNYPNALGYSFRYYVTSMVGEGELKLLQIDGIAPTIENIQNGTYPLASEFYVITAGTENPNVKPLIDWILSSEGQTLIEKTGYVPVGETLE